MALHDYDSDLLCVSCSNDSFHDFWNITYPFCAVIYSALLIHVGLSYLRKLLQEFLGHCAWKVLQTAEHRQLQLGAKNEQNVLEMCH